ncbi:MAG: PIN domain-containing protein [Solirubrobacteraceae bacterium]
MVRSGSLSGKAEVEPGALERPALFDTGVWTWVRDRRFPALASWFNAQATAGRVLVCDLIVLELVRLAPNERRALEVTQRLEAFESIAMPAELWTRARDLQRLLSASGDHRRVPPIDLLIGAAAERAGVPLVHYDRDYERIARIGSLQAHWFVPDGTLV